MSAADHPPVQFAMYPGDVSECVGQVVGPMYAPSLGQPQMLTAVEAIYDPMTRKTRVGFAYGVLDLDSDGAA